MHRSGTCGWWLIASKAKGGGPYGRLKALSTPPNDSFYIYIYRYKPSTLFEAQGDYQASNSTNICLILSNSYGIYLFRMLLHLKFWYPMLHEEKDWSIQ